MEINVEYTHRGYMERLQYSLYLTGPLPALQLPDGH